MGYPSAMNVRRLPQIVIVIAAFSTPVLACSSGTAGRGTPGAPGTAGQVAAPQPSAELTRVNAVSASSTADDQIAATDACWITDSKDQLVSSFGFKGLKGAGRVTPARSIPDYVPLWGIEPEIQTDAPGWVFWFNGVVNIPIDIVERDPVCVVINGEPTWYSVGASYVDGNWVETKPPPNGGPTKTLPELQP